MTIERYLRLIAGFFVMLSVALGYWVNPAWFLFTGFRRLEPVPVGIYQLVPDDDDPPEAGCRRFAQALVGRKSDSQVTCESGAAAYWNSCGANSFK